MFGTSLFFFQIAFAPALQGQQVASLEKKSAETTVVRHDASVDPVMSATKEAKKQKKSKSGKVKWKPTARIVARFGHETKHSAPATSEETSVWQPSLLQARVGATATWKKRLEVNASAELSDGISGSGGVAYLRNAFLTWSPTKLFRLRVGHFKRPFSTMAMMARYDLWAPERPLLHRAAIRNRVTTLGWGQRAVGAMVLGKVGHEKHEVSWRVSATDPHYDGQGLDVHAFAAYGYADTIEIAAYGAYKRGKNVDNVYDVGAGGLAIQLQGAGLNAILEADAVQNWQLEGKPWLGSALALVRYEFSLPASVVVGPIASVEVADDQLDAPKGLALRWLGGAIVGWDRVLRGSVYAISEQPLGSDGPTQSWRERLGFFMALGVSL
jgi:hypothetical protein